MIKEKKHTNKKSSHLDSNIADVQKQLELNLGLKINISNKKNNSGKISIEYKNLEQFDLIANLLKRS